MQRLYCLLVLSVSLILSVPGLSYAGPSDIPAYADGNTAALVGQSANSRKEYAEKMKSQAAQYRELETNARKYATTAQDIKDRKMWEKSAEDYAAQAQKLEDDAAKELGKAGDETGQAQTITNRLADDKKAADAAAAEAAKAEAARSAAQSDKGGADDSKLKAIPLEEVIGGWTINGEDHNFVIVQEDPDSESYPYKLQAHTGKHIWTGNYTSFDKGELARSQDARVVFHYKPKAEEMNPEIPEWAREKIAGKLEWAIELDEAGTCGTPSMTGKWFPGEVKWPENGEGEVEITGKGDPRPVSLVRTGYYDVDMLGYPSLQVYLSPEHNPLVDPIEGLIKRQRFYVRVVLPRAMAEKQGKTLDIAIEGLTNGGKDTITLQAGSQREGRGMTYSTPAAVTIADSNDARERDRKPKFMSEDWFKEKLSLGHLDGNTGDRLLLDVENAEPVKFSFGDTYETIPVYNSWVQRDLVRFEAGAERLRVFYEILAARPGLTPEQKAAITLRQKMLANLDQMSRSDLMNDLYRHALYQRYLGRNGEGNDGLIFGDPASIAQEMEVPYVNHDNDVRFMNPLMKAALEGLSHEDLSPKMPKLLNTVNWASPTEETLVRRTMMQANLSLDRAVMDEIPTAMTLSLYDGYLLGTQTAMYYLAITGEDHFGNKRNWAERAAAIGGVLQHLDLFEVPPSLSPRHLLDRITGRAVELREGKPRMFISDRARLGRPDYSGEPFSYGTNNKAFPETLSPGQLEEIRPRSELSGRSDVRPPTAGRPFSCGAGLEPPSNPRLRGMDESGIIRLEPDVRKQLEQDKAVMQDFYEGEARIIDQHGPAPYRRQVFGDCNMESILNIVEKKTGERIPAMRAYAEATKAGIIDPTSLPADKNPLVYGYTNPQASALAALKGFDSFEIPGRRNALITLEDMSRLKDAYGFEIKAVVTVGRMDKIREAYRKAAAGGGRFDMTRLREQDIPDFHAIHVLGFRKNAAGEVTHVSYRDSAVGRDLEMSSCTFYDRLSKFENYGNTTFYKWNGDPK